MAVGENFFTRLFFSEKVPFSEKRDVNWKAIKWTLLSLVTGFVLVVLVLPSSSEDQPPQELRAQSPFVPQPEQNPSERLPNTRELSAQYQATQQMSAPATRSGSMIVSRSGLDYRTQLPPGTRIRVRLLQGAIVSTESMPIIAEVIVDVSSDSGIAIERGSKIFGEASYDSTGDVATVVWASIQSPDGRERQLSAIGVSLSGHVGVQGKIHSKRAANIAGSTISRFIGAYAEGSVTRGVLGFSQGGAENGLKTAVAETAKDQADSYANDLKREKRWIELVEGSESLVVLKQPFSFRDPGSYAR